MPCDAPQLNFCKDPNTGCTQDYSVCGECPYKSEGVCDGVDNDCDWNTDEDFSVQQECDLGDDLCPGLVACDKGTILCEPTELPAGAPETLTNCANNAPTLEITPSGFGEGASHKVWVWTPSDYSNLSLGYNGSYCAGATCATSLACGGKLWVWSSVANELALQPGSNELKVYQGASSEAAPCSDDSASILSEESICESCE